MRRILPSLLTLVALSATAEDTFTPNDVHDNRNDAYAMVGATIHVAPGQSLSEASLLIRDGRIIAVGTDVDTNGYVIVDASGRHIYPGLIDLYSGYGLPEPAQPAPFSFGSAEILDSQTPGAYNANQAIRADYSAAESFAVNAEAASTWRKMGFGAVLTHMADGIARGSAALVTLGDNRAHEEIVLPKAATLYSFSKGSSAQSFPISTMGSVALLRQTFLDARWYAKQQDFVDQSLAAMNEHSDLPKIFEARDWMDILRVDTIAREFETPMVIKTAGDEYRRLDAIKDTGASLIVPLQFPDAMDVSDPLDARRVSWADMKHWEMAPRNPAQLEQAGIRFALTSGGDEKNFHKNLRKAVTMGLTPKTALAALTTIPAQMIGADGDLGTLEAGKLANFLVTSGPLSDEDTTIEDNWISGHRYPVTPYSAPRDGLYTISLADQTFELTLEKSTSKPSATIIAQPAEDDAEPEKARIDFDRNLVTLSFNGNRLTGWKTQDRWQGRAQLADGTWTDWSAMPAPMESGFEENDETDDESDESTEAPAVPYPFSPYGRSAMPSQDSIVFRNATVWTLTDDDPVLENADVLVEDGEIVAVGSDLGSANREVDATGMHVTPGIVDEHSHIALSGVNDIATNSGMVRMRDVVDSEDINIYRNLAGGVTAAQLLHGSANPIGGQSALIKMRWGATPEEMLIKDVDGFIKFALGENVKRSRNDESIRYPQSRMGVEQVYRDAFSQAREYERRLAAYDELSRRERERTPPPRRDLALDAMVEILNQERFITCHSYVQSEINMLMHVADDFDFTVNTFTHILEGYKVADKMAAHGAGGSTFSDWWAYKWEVRYAIPYNAALMTQAGVVTAINSDSSEMSRRLNQEAAKSVRYGGMSEVEALKMVTLNPAKLLHLDDRIGTIEAGKDADLVLWTDHPLSIYAKPAKTLVDGRVMFDLEQDEAAREWIRSDRARLIAKHLEAAEKNGGGKKPGFSPQRDFHCDSITGYEHLASLRQ